MRAVNVEEMKEIDKWAISKVGIPRIVLMENAGRSVVDVISKEIGKVEQAAVIVGKGFNGGDGIVVARHLKNSGVEVSLFLLGYSEELKEESKLNFNIAHMMGVEIWEIKDEPDLKKLEDRIKNYDLIVDAIFGIGLSGEVRGLPAKVIELINNSKKANAQVVAVDVPSGINADTGEVFPPTLVADLTVTFHLPKIGLLKFPASQAAGKVVIADIGIPYENSKVKIKNSKIPTPKSEENIEVTDIKFVESVIPRRKVDAYKGSCGSVLVIAGSVGMSGAAILSARAALRAGAGLVKLACPESLTNFIDTMTAEVITLSLPETYSKSISLSAFNKIIQIAEQFDAIIVGPGMSSDKETSKLIIKLVESDKIKIPIVLDADGLNAISKNISILKKREATTIITPHPGELSRLLKIDIGKIQADRIKAAKLIAKEMNVTMVLKGAYTVISDGGEKVYINPTGNPGMASAGVGDVLSGIIASFIAQGTSVYEAAIAGVFIHGMAGDVVASLKGEQGLIASDIVEALPYVLQSIVRKK